MSKVKHLIHIHTREREIGQMSKHHRLCRSHKKGVHNNTVRISRKAHEGYHLLFDNAHPWEVAEVLNRLFIDPDYELVCIRREK